MSDSRLLDPAASTCPDFEVLSCFADGELEPSQATEVSAHVSTCARCAMLARHLREDFGVADVRRDGSVAGSGCAGEESLILYLRGEARSPEADAVERHLETCDACVSRLTVLYRRLGVDSAVDRSVPAEVRERSERALAIEAARAARAHRAQRRAGLRRQRLNRLLRFPVLIPVAVAAGALMMVSIQEGWIGSGFSVSHTRAVGGYDQLRVTVPEAPVRGQPSTRGDIVTTLPKGTVVTVTGEEHGWYRIALAGDRSGWVEREAFE
jgi:anti-sigma factor RsiW